MAVNACGGSGDIYDPEHRRTCLECRSVWGSSAPSLVALVVVVAAILAAMIAALVLLEAA
jgi:hypothetical protein